MMNLGDIAGDAEEEKEEKEEEEDMVQLLPSKHR